MKNLTLLFAACSMAIMSYAAGGNITYELNGGVTNTHGWKNKNDMYMGLNASWNAFKPATTTWTALDVLVTTWVTAESAVPKGIPTEAATIDKPFILDPTVAAEWQWLVDYMDAACVAQAKALASTGGSALRYNLSAFFLSSVRTGWPASPNYAVLGQPEAFIPAWKHAFAGPATYDGTVEIVIPSPYKEGYTFDGWYDNAGFTGTKVLSIAAGAEGNKILYAKWIEYIPTAKEVKALGAGKTTKAGGIVTFIKGTTVYLQDASGGLKVEFTFAPDIVIGNKITLLGTTASLGSYITVTTASFLTKETATLPDFQTVTLADLALDVAPYMFEYVSLEGLTITSYDANGYATLSDGVSNSILMAVVLPQATYTIGTKIDMKLVVAFNNEVQLVGPITNIKKSPLAGKDSFSYPVKHGKYSLNNVWLYSNKLDNYTANKVGQTDLVRGMVAANGKMYFIDSKLEQLTVVEGATGTRLAPIKLETNIFATCEKPVGGIYALNDLKQDNAGNVLLGNGITSNKKPFQVWKINLADGTGTLVVNEILLNNPDFAANTMRFDAFGVYGDVNNNAIILAASANAMEVYKWTITNGVAGPAELIIIDTTIAGNYLTGLANPGTAPRVFPLDENLFYLDGFATLPTLIDMDGNIIDGFYQNEAVQSDITTIPGQTIKINTAPNGIIEFDVADDHFLITGCTNTDGTPPSTFRLFKYADANKEFSDLECLWTFSAVGFGSASNQGRAVVPSVEVTVNVAKIYVYYGENGYGVYEFSNSPTGLNNLNNNAVTVFVNNKALTLSKEVANVEVYSVAGQLVAKATSVSSISVLSNGVFLVKATTYEGETAIHKVVVQ